jgi:hypothetical protein
MAIEYAFPDLKGRRTLYARVLRDLEWDDLVEPGARRFMEAVKTMAAGISLEGHHTEVLTAYGRAFLQFVSAPDFAA